MTYRFYLTVTPFHATVACDSRSPPSSVRSALTPSPTEPQKSLPAALPAAAHRHPLPLLTTHHPLPTVFLSVLYFHILTNPLAGNPFIFTSIQNPRECTLCGPQCSDLRTLCVALFLQLLCPQTIAASFHFFALFSASLSFVFNQLQPLFQNTRGMGIPDGSAGWGSTQLRTTYNPLPTFFCLSNRLHGRNKFGDINADSGQFGPRVEFRWEFFVGYLFQPH